MTTFFPPPLFPPLSPPLSLSSFLSLSLAVFWSFIHPLFNSSIFSSTHIHKHNHTLPFPLSPPPSFSPSLYCSPLCLLSLFFLFPIALLYHCRTLSIFISLHLLSVFLSSTCQHPAPFSVSST